MKTVITFGVAAVLSLSTALRASDQIPAPPQARPIAIVGADIFPCAAPPIPGGTIIFDKGRIVALGRNVQPPADAELIDAKGKRVYPGLFDPVSDLGLVEISAVRQSVDTAETGSINPNVRAETAINPDSEHIPVARSNGVLLTVVAPTGGVISGSSAVIQLDGWTYEDLTVKAPAAIHMNWPAMRPQTRRFGPAEPDAEQNRRRDEQLEQINKTFDNARAYKRARESNASATPHDSRWHAMLPMLSGEIPLVVNANDVMQIQAAVAFAQRQKVRLIIDGGYDATLCAELLKKHNVPVIIAGTHRLPQRRGDGYDDAFTLPRRLSEAGVKFVIGSMDRFNGNYRNLPYNAATAATFGLPPGDALAAITLGVAELYGVADRVGSLTVGKDATLFIASGDIFEVPTQVEAAFIQGRKIDLSDKQKMLYRKYQIKFEQLKNAPRP